jgi:hypothetical protein
MFRTLAPLDPAGDGTEADGERRLAELADAMAGEKEEPFEREQEIVDTRSDKAGDSEENAAIPAGYTYLGQSTTTSRSTRSQACAERTT